MSYCEILIEWEIEKLIEPAVPHVQVIDKSLALLQRIIRDGGQTSLREQAASLGLPLSTAYRIVANFVKIGWVCSMERGFYSPSLGLLDMVGRVDRNAILAGVAAPFVRQMSRRLGKTVHLGVFEDDMVTYLLKEGEGVPAGFTRAGMQLEAYCSGIGKILLSHLPDAEREGYLASGPFVSLTPSTVVDPQSLREMLNAAREHDYALDVCEVSENLWCIAVPVRNTKGVVVAALSVSRLAEEDKEPLDMRILGLLRQCATRISQRL